MRPESPEPQPCCSIKCAQAHCVSPLIRDFRFKTSQTKENGKADVPAKRKKRETSNPSPLCYRKREKGTENAHLCKRNSACSENGNGINSIHDPSWVDPIRNETKNFDAIAFDCEQTVIYVIAVTITSPLYPAAPQTSTIEARVLDTPK